MSDNLTRLILNMVRNNRITSEEGLLLIEGIRDESAPQIAVIGMSGRFPDADNLGEFWRNLCAGRDSVREIPAERFELSEFYDPDPRTAGKSYSKWAGLLSDVDRFDPAFFNMTPKEAELADPQQRLFLQEAWRAVEDAGIAPHELSGTRCGVYAGCASGDYQFLLQDAPDSHAFTGNAASILPARVSHFLNLKGPSVAVDTACSSSLMAIHLACESIAGGACEMALAGGVTVFSTPNILTLAGEMGMLSSTGKCRTFDNAADGMVISEGVAVVVLEPLKKAIRDGRFIYGVIRGSGANQDGRTPGGITVPNASSQSALVREVLRKCKIAPETVGYVEAHGTGTKLGDPVEVEALCEAFGKSVKRRSCAIGSVKTNIGHAQAAAGMAGFVKAVLCLRHGRLVPHLHLNRENEHINFEESPFYVNTELREWERRQDTPRRAALSAFGMSGTNVHMVLEEHARPQEVPSEETPQIVVLSAKNREALREYAGRMAEFLSSGDGRHAPLADFAHTLRNGREAMDERLAFVAESAAGACEKLKAFLENGEGFFSGNAGKKPSSPISGREGEAYVRVLAEDRRLEKLARVWVEGAKIDWSLLPGGRRLPLPAYPFSKERFWAKPRAAQASAGQAPPTDERPPLSAGEAGFLYRPAWVASPPETGFRETSGAIAIAYSKRSSNLAKFIAHVHGKERVTFVRTDDS